MCLGNYWNRFQEHLTMNLMMAGISDPAFMKPGTRPTNGVWIEFEIVISRIHSWKFWSSFLFDRNIISGTCARSNWSMDQGSTEKISVVCNVLPTVTIFCVMCKASHLSQIFYYIANHISWWRHEIETLSMLLALCEGNPLVFGVFSSQRPVMQSFDVFSDLCLKKWLSKQSRCWRFEMPLCLLWCHCNVRS